MCDADRHDFENPEYFDADTSQDLCVDMETSISNPLLPHNENYSGVAAFSSDSSVRDSINSEC